MHEFPTVALGIALGPRVRKSPFYEATLRCGASVFTIYNHMYMPMAYSAEPGRDYWNAVNGVQLWDVACERQVEVAGADALRFAQYLTPRDLAPLEVGCAAYALIVNTDGGILNDPVVLRVDTDRYWFSLADSDALLWAQGLAAHGDWDVTVSEPRVSPLQVQGANSIELVASVFGDWARELGFYRFRETEIDGIPLLLARMGYSHERCFELFLLDESRGDDLWNILWSAGRDLDVTGGAPNQALRLEAGLLSYLSDMNARTNPFEVGLGWSVNLDKQADFVGREVLSGLSNNGTARRLVGVEIDGEPLWAGNQNHWPVAVGGEPAGHLTSCGYSPRLEKNIGYCMLASGADTIGEPIIIETPHGNLHGCVVDMPWIGRQK
jgi:aminomethyltransferase